MEDDSEDGEAAPEFQAAANGGNAAWDFSPRFGYPTHELVYSYRNLRGQ
jgi:hypothetical protein